MFITQAQEDHLDANCYPLILSFRTYQDNFTEKWANSSIKILNCFSLNSRISRKVISILG